MPQLIHDCETAKKHLEQENIIAIPTETVYGIAADANSSKVIAKIYDLKQRPLDKTLALNIHRSWSIEDWCHHIPQYTYQHITQFWPGQRTRQQTSKFMPTDCPKKASCSYSKCSIT